MNEENSPLTPFMKPRGARREGRAAKLKLTWGSGEEGAAALGGRGSLSSSVGAQWGFLHGVVRQGLPSLLPPRLELQVVERLKRGSWSKIPMGATACGELAAVCDWLSCPSSKGKDLQEVSWVLLG